MKTIMFGIAVLLVAVIGSVMAQPATLDSLRDSYEKAKVGIDSGYEDAKAEAQVAYSTALSTTMDDLKKAGNLDGVLAVKAEMESFSTNKTTPNILHPYLVKAVMAYSNDQVVIESSKVKDTAKLLKNYVVALGDLIKQLTQQDKLDEAVKAQDEKKKAEFELADIEAKLPKAQAVKMKLVNMAIGASVEANRANKFDNPEKAIDGVINDVNNESSYWYSGGGKPHPDWIKLTFKRDVKVYSVRILVPTSKSLLWPNREPFDYEVIGLNHSTKTILAKVVSGKHSKIEPGWVPTVQWIIVELQNPKALDGVQLTIKRSSGEKVSSIIFEIEVVGTVVADIESKLPTAHQLMVQNTQSH